MDLFIYITMILLIVAMFITMIRMVIGPTVWDRLLALNLIMAKTIVLLTLYGVHSNNVLLLDVAISSGIIGFIGIALLSRFIRQGGRLK